MSLHTCVDHMYKNMTVKIKNICNVIHELKPTILMVIAETIMGVNNVLYKLAVNDGFDLRILVTYRFLFAAAFMVPVALFVERSLLIRNTHTHIRVHAYLYAYSSLDLNFIVCYRNTRPKLTWTVIWQSLLAAFIGYVISIHSFRVFGDYFHVLL